MFNKAFWNEMDKIAACGIIHNKSPRQRALHVEQAKKKKKSRPLKMEKVAISKHKISSAIIEAAIKDLKKGKFSQGARDLIEKGIISSSKTNIGNLSRSNRFERAHMQDLIRDYKKGIREKISRGKTIRTTNVSNVSSKNPLTNDPKRVESYRKWVNEYTPKKIRYKGEDLTPGEIGHLQLHFPGK
jgi:hypothetical protein